MRTGELSAGPPEPCGLDPADREDTSAGLARRATAARLELEALSRRLEDSQARFRETTQQVGSGRMTQRAPRDPQPARLTARLAAVPVIEQAKGVLIAQTGCDAEEAAAMLRARSQRASLPVRDLAADIVARASSGSRGGRPLLPRQPGSRGSQ